MSTPNPYRDVIAWLRSAEGESWSQRRLAVAKSNNRETGSGLTHYHDSTEFAWKGILCVKSDDLKLPTLAQWRWSYSGEKCPLP